MVKFFVDDKDINENIVTLNERESKHIQKVLRMKKGEKLLVSDNSQNTFLCEIYEMIENKVICNILEKYNNNTETALNITLFQCVAKFDKMDYIIQKATELGIKDFYPVISTRVIVKLDDSGKKKKVERWQIIANEASKQSKRDLIPTIENVIFLKDICNLASKYDMILLAYENDKTSLKTILQENKSNIKNIAIVIGPEGGFEQQEVDMLTQLSNVKSISLGKRILRTETSSNTLISVILYEFDEI